MDILSNEVLYRTIQKITLAAVVAAASVGAVSAQTQHPSQGVQPAPLAANRSAPPCPALQECADEQFDESGTVGREDLGADPTHPEGPGEDADN